MTELALWAMVLLPAAVGGVFVMSRQNRIATPVSLTVASITVLLAVVVAVTRPQVSVPFVAGAEFSMGVDALSALMVPTVAAVTLLALIFAAGDIRASQARFHGLMLIFAAAALATATAQSLPTLLMAWEIMGAMSFALIGFWWRDEERVASGTVAFVTTRTADLGIYLAAGAALAGGAGFVLADLSGSSPGWRHVIAAGILVAALGKAAQLPFSFWLSRAMDGPSPVSALLHSAAMVAMGGYLLLRTQPLLASTGWAGPTAAWVGAITALIMGAVAVAQRDLKQLLAASTAAQLGFVVMGAGLGAITGGATHLVAHASTKALLFLAAGAWLAALGTKKFAGLEGVARRWPVVGWTATVGALSLAGIAPLALWATKDAVLAPALEQSWPLYAVGLAGAALSAAYAGKILVVVWRPLPTEPSAADGGLDTSRLVPRGDYSTSGGSFVPRGDYLTSGGSFVPRGDYSTSGGSFVPRGDYSTTGEYSGSRVVGLAEKIPLAVLAVGAVVLGVLALPPVGESIARSLGDQSPGSTLLELAVSGGIALAVVLLIWWRGVPEPRWALKWLGLGSAVRTMVVQPTLALAKRCARFDDDVLDRAVMHGAESAMTAAPRIAAFDDDTVDGGIEAMSERVVGLADRSASVDGHWLDGAVEKIAAGARWLGRLARRPQTGQLHQYYIQAVAVLAVGVLLLVVVR